MQGAWEQINAVWRRVCHQRVWADCDDARDAACASDSSPCAESVKAAASGAGAGVDGVESADDSAAWLSPFKAEDGVVVAEEGVDAATAGDEEGASSLENNDDRRESTPPRIPDSEEVAVACESDSSA